jgi:hypothetical protein
MCLKKSAMEAFGFASLVSCCSESYLAAARSESLCVRRAEREERPEEESFSRERRRSRVS